jgi:two-component system OmpR family response regulator
MISARTEKDDVTHGLRLGADDYIRKPFSVEELVLRVENRLRRTSNSEVETFICGPIELNELKHQVLFKDQEIELSPTEFNLLLALIHNQNRVMTKEKLLDLVWGLDFETSTNVVDTYISYLRKKLHKDGFEGIKTVRGVGFKLDSQ